LRSSRRHPAAARSARTRTQGSTGPDPDTRLQLRRGGRDLRLSHRDTPLADSPCPRGSARRAPGAAPRQLNGAAPCRDRTPPTAETSPTRDSRGARTPFDGRARRASLRGQPSTAGTAVALRRHTAVLDDVAGDAAGVVGAFSPRSRLSASAVRTKTVPNA